MLYTRSDGSISTLPDYKTVVAETGLLKLENAVKVIDDYYEHLNTSQHARLRALAGRLIAMVEE